MGLSECEQDCWAGLFKRVTRISGATILASPLLATHPSVVFDVNVALRFACRGQQGPRYRLEKKCKKRALPVA
jgi:hypothetical protein